MRPRLTPITLLTLGALGAYCADTAIDAARDAGTRDAGAQTGGGGRTETQLARGTLNAGFGAEASSDPIGIGGYDRLLLQWFDPAPECQDPDIFVDGRLADDAPYVRIIRSNQPGITPVPPYGQQVVVRLLNDGQDPCDVEYILVGVRDR